MNNNQLMPIHYPGMSEAQKKLTMEILDEWEKDFEDNVVHCKSGYVDIIQQKDYIIAAVINLVIIIYYFIAIS